MNDINFTAIVGGSLIAAVVALLVFYLIKQHRERNKKEDYEEL